MDQAGQDSGTCQNMGGLSLGADWPSSSAAPVVVHQSQMAYRLAKAAPWQRLACTKKMGLRVGLVEVIEGCPV